MTKSKLLNILKQHPIKTGVGVSFMSYTLFEKSSLVNSAFDYFQAYMNSFFTPYTTSKESIFGYEVKTTNLIETINKISYYSPIVFFGAIALGLGYVTYRLLKKKKPIDFSDENLREDLRRDLERVRTKPTLKEKIAMLEEDKSPEDLVREREDLVQKYKDEMKRIKTNPTEDEINIMMCENATPEELVRRKYSL